MGSKSSATQQSVLITGASTGIGKACSEALAKLGWLVFAGVRQTADADALTQMSPNIIPVTMDVTQLESIQHAAEAVRAYIKDHPVRSFSIVNNAGVVVAGPLEFLPLKDIQQQFDINVYGTLAVTQTFLPVLRSVAMSQNIQESRVLMMSSIAGLTAVPFLGPYCASKYALEALSDALRMELSYWGIPVSIIEPGSIRTPLWDKSDDRIAKMVDALPDVALKLYKPFYNRLRASAKLTAKQGGSPDEVVRTVVNVLSCRQPKTRYLVGKDAQWRPLLKWIPDRIKDRMISRAMGLPTQPTAAK